MTGIPGVLVLWSGNTPRRTAYRIPPGGLVLGRDLIEETTDDRISRQHVELRVQGRALTAKDLGSRNGTSVDGAGIEKHVPVNAWLPSVVRAARTVAVVVPDIRRYEEPSPVLDVLQRDVDQAARAEENVTIEGTLDVGLELARRYAKTVGGDVCEFDPRRGGRLDQFLTGTRPRTLIMMLVGHALEMADLPTMRAWMETDVRIVTLMTYNTKPLSMLGAPDIARLRRRVIELWPRFDEMPALIVDTVRAAAPDTEVHATVIETMLRAMLKFEDEARLLTDLGRFVEHWVRPGPMEDVIPVDRSRLRGDDVQFLLSPPNSGVFAVAPGIPRL